MSALREQLVIWIPLAYFNIRLWLDLPRNRGHRVEYDHQPVSDDFRERIPEIFLDFINHFINVSLYGTTAGR